MKKLLMLLCLFATLGLSAQDKKVVIKTATADNYQTGNEASYAIDGNTSTIWHTAWSPQKDLPATLTLTLRTVSHVDYVRYIPRMDGNENGNWVKVEVAYCPTTTGSTFTSLGTYTLDGSNNSFDFSFGEEGLECGKIRFTIKQGMWSYASAAEIEAYAIDNTMGEEYAKYFEDALCTVLKPEVTSSEGIENQTIKKLVDNILSNPQGYKKFRVGEYEAYLPTSTLQGRLRTSSYYNNYENPTGIYLKNKQSCVVFVEGISDKHPVSLKIKNWVKDESSSSYKLRNGYNYITAISEGNVFVSYYSDDFENAPNVKLHFVNAPVQGYWDSKTMTNTDWVNMLDGRSATDSTIIITRSEHAQLAYPVFAWLQHCPRDIETTMNLYQQVQWALRDILGLKKYNREMKNRQLYYATTYGFMAAGGEGAYCNVNSLGAIMVPDATQFDFWGVGHEWGHNNQITPGFKWTGCGETTNNIYAAWAQLKFTGKRHSLRLEDEYSGVNDYSGMRGGRFQTYFEEGLRKGVAWQLQDGPDYHGETPTAVTVTGQDADGKSTGSVNTTWRHYDHFVKLSPFWQLQLWGTLAEKCPDIIAMVIESIRSTPNYGSTYNTNGKQQINWMKLACDSTKLNLLPFFEKAGMLRPINAYVDDYAKGWNIINTSMINKLKSHVEKQGYAEVTEEVNYITAHNYHIYRNNLKLEVPEELGKGCTYQNGKVTVSHKDVKNAVAFETYNQNGELVRITMYGLGSNDAHDYTQVLYPGSSDEAEAAAYIVAVGYDGARQKIYEKVNIQKGLTDNGFYRIVSNSKGNALTSGANTQVGEDGTITWSMQRAAKAPAKLDQIWQWQKRDGNRYLYNPQSNSYFGGASNSLVSKLDKQADAPAWEAACVDEARSVYTFNQKGSGNYINAYSDVNTGLYTGGAGDANNLWVVEQVKSFSASVSSYGFLAVCYPFAVEVPEGLTPYYVTEKATYSYEGADYEYAVLEKFDSQVVPAFMPVIYQGEKDTYLFYLVGEDETVAPTNNLLKGTTLKAKIAKGSALTSLSATTEAGATAVIKGSASTTNINANRSYLLKADVDGASQLYLGIKDQLTAIEAVTVNNGQPAVFYNLDGTKAGKLQSGRIYITADGKKILVQ